MSTDILARIQAQLHTFSKGQKRIANYILESYDKAAFMTASKLGKTVAVSESTVVRFAVELGFDGYPSMQRSLQEMVRTRLTSVQRIEAANDRFGDQDVVSSVLQSDIDSIRLTAESLDRRELAACYRSCLALAAEHGLRSVAFCCISTGEFHFPNELAAEIAVATVKEFLKKQTSVKKVIFNVFKDLDKAIYEKLL